VNAFPFTSAFLEMLHDVGVGLTWPGVEPVAKNECRDLGLLDSSVQLPFQSVFGAACYPGIPAKAGCLFFSIIANHPFWNGNKRTAVLALDLFMAANGHVLNLTNPKIYNLAKEVATYKERRAGSKEVLDRITWVITRTKIPMWRFKSSKYEWKYYRQIMEQIRLDPLNVPGTLTQQEQIFGRATQR